MPWKMRPTGSWGGGGGGRGRGGRVVHSSAGMQACSDHISRHGKIVLLSMPFSVKGTVTELVAQPPRTKWECAVFAGLGVLVAAIARV